VEIGMTESSIQVVGARAGLALWQWHTGAGPLTAKRSRPPARRCDEKITAPARLFAPRRGGAWQG